LRGISTSWSLSPLHYRSQRKYESKVGRATHTRLKYATQPRTQVNTWAQRTTQGVHNSNGAQITNTTKQMRGSKCVGPDSPVKFSRTPRSFSREQLVHHRSAWRTGHCSVHHRTVRCARPGTRAGVGCTQPTLSHFFSPSFVTVSSTYANTLVLKNNVLSLETYLVIWFVFLSLFST
jgi:hypothetical protein